jgi:hypothetical protein
MGRATVNACVANSAAGVSGDWHPRLLRESAPLLASILFEADRGGSGPAVHLIPAASAVKHDLG